MTNEDTGFNIGPDNVACDVKVDSDELSLQENNRHIYVRHQHRFIKKPLMQLSSIFLASLRAQLCFKHHLVHGDDRHTVRKKMSILGDARLTGQKESQACLRFPDSDCVCV